MIGEIFGRLTVLSIEGKNKHGKVLLKCKCSCGNIITTVRDYLRNGDTKSCGCLGRESRINSRIKHGQSHNNTTTEYEIWKGMKARCYNENNIGYKNYGGRGIKVCDAWLHSFENFLLDMGKRPSNNHSIDRFPDTNGNYTPTNCRWATIECQSRNKRNNRKFTHNGATMVMEDWAKYFGVHQSTLHEHLETKSFDTVFEFYNKKNNRNYQSITTSRDA